MDGPRQGKENGKWVDFTHVRSIFNHVVHSREMEKIKYKEDTMKKNNNMIL